MAALVDALESALDEVGALEASGDLSGATAAAAAALDAHPSSRAAQLCWASLLVRTQLESVAADQALLHKVYDALSHCAAVGGGAKRGFKAAAKAAEASEADTHQRCVALGLRGVLEGQVLGDLQSAVASFEASLAIEPTNVDSLYCYATLLDQGLGDGAQAGELYERVLAVDAAHVTTLNNYAALLIERARSASEGDAMGLLGRAKALLYKAQALAPGFPAYNLACVAGIQLARFGPTGAARDKLVSECKFSLLEAWRAGGIPSANDLAQDEDLAAVRDELWFSGLLGELRNLYIVEFDGAELQLRPPPGNVCSQSDTVMGDLGASSSTAVAASSSSTSASLDSAAMNVVGAESAGSDAVGCAKASPGVDKGAQPQQERVGTTGWTVWTSSYVMLRIIEDYLERAASASSPSWGRREWWIGKRVMDLSAGLGLVGLAAARLGASVLLTDIGKKQIETLRANVSLNGFDETQVAAQELAWGDNSALEQATSSYGPFNLVFACDLVYIGCRDDIMEPLADTLLRTISGGATLLLCFESRQPLAERALLETLEAHCNIVRHTVDPSHLPGPEDEGESPDAMFAGLSFHEAPDIVCVELTKK